VSVRAGLEEAVGARWWRTRVKRRKASVVGELARSGDALFLLVPRAYWRRDRREISSVLPQEICWVPARLAGRPEDEMDGG